MLQEVVSFINERKRSVENLSKLVDVIETIAGVPEVPLLLQSLLTLRRDCSL